MNFSFMVTNISIQISFVFTWHHFFLDAFARVIIGSQAADTRVIWETRSPTWDQMIIFHDIIVWGDVNTIASNPPTIVTEIFDKDIGVRMHVLIGVIYCDVL